MNGGDVREKTWGKVNAAAEMASGMAAQKRRQRAEAAYNRDVDGNRVFYRYFLDRQSSEAHHNSNGDRQGGLSGHQSD
jgi:hypothetical protein